MSNIETVDSIGVTDSSRTAGTYSVSSFTTSGTGTGAVFTVTVDGSGEASVVIATKGSNYAVKDTIIVADSQLGDGGGSPLSFAVEPISG